jgi:hypothetical protein
VFSNFFEAWACIVWTCLVLFFTILLNLKLTCIIFQRCWERSLKRAIITSNSTNNSVGDVGDNVFNLGVEHEETSNAHDTNQGLFTSGSKGGIPSSRDPYLDKIIVK